MNDLTLLLGDCLETMKGLPDNSVDAVVTDPPYGLSFMGKSWDHGVPGVEFWREMLRIMKPGAHLAAFSGTRTYHRMAVAIEDAGFQVRDMCAWVYGSGFPKSHDVSKAIDREAGAEREKIRINADDLKNPPNMVGGVNNGSDRPWRIEAIEKGYHEIDSDAPATEAAKKWSGWGTALKPAQEPICIARKPLIGTVAQNVQEWGTGALNIDGCRIVAEKPTGWGGGGTPMYEGGLTSDEAPRPVIGRWPANLCHDGSEEVLRIFPDSKSGEETAPRGTGGIWSGESNAPCGPQYGNTGSAARFFYCAKAGRQERDAGARHNHHPTVKPVALMRWLCRLMTPPGGLILDPFMGSGTTGIAARVEGFRFIGCEREPEYMEIARRRILHWNPADADEPANDNAPGKPQLSLFG